MRYGGVGYAYTELVGFILIALVLLLILATIGMIGYVIYYYVLRGWLAPVRRVVARIVRKADREHEVDLPAWVVFGYSIWGLIWRLMPWYDDQITVYHSWDYFITFEFDNKQQEYSVPESLYSSVSEGDEGLLVYKGNLLTHFIPHAQEVEEIIPPKQGV